MTRNLLSLEMERVQLQLENVRSVTLWKRKRRKEEVDGTGNDVGDYASWQGESIYVNTSGYSDSSEWLIESFSRAFVPHWPVSYNHIVAIFIPRSGIVLRTYRYNYLNGNRRMEWFAASEVQWRLRLTILISFFRYLIRINLFYFI